LCAMPAVAAESSGYAATFRCFSKNAQVAATSDRAMSTWFSSMVTTWITDEFDPNAVDHHAKSGLAGKPG
jgi:hypothetical protein